jgi:hypothetical protein
MKAVKKILNKELTMMMTRKIIVQIMTKITVKDARRTLNRKMDVLMTMRSVTTRRTTVTNAKRGTQKEKKSTTRVSITNTAGQITIMNIVTTTSTYATTRAVAVKKVDTTDYPNVTAAAKAAAVILTVTVPAAALTVTVPAVTLAVKVPAAAVAKRRRLAATVDYLKLPVTNAMGAVTGAVTSKRRRFASAVVTIKLAVTKVMEEVTRGVIAAVTTVTIVTAMIAIVNLTAVAVIAAVQAMIAAVTVTAVQTAKVQAAATRAVPSARVARWNLTRRTENLQIGTTRTLGDEKETNETISLMQKNLNRTAGRSSHSVGLGLGTLCCKSNNFFPWRTTWTSCFEIIIGINSGSFVTRHLRTGLKMVTSVIQ